MPSATTTRGGPEPGREARAGRRAPGVYGLEHELGLSITPAEALCCPPGASRAAAMLALGGYPGLNSSAAQYLANGGRLYVDCGEHPEYATPECATPQELLAADSAGVALLDATARRAEAALAEESGLDVRVRLLRNNSAPNGESWGAHENYLVTSELSGAELAEPLASHLASRVCVVGAGTVLAGGDQPAGRFRLSQRAPFVTCVRASSAVSAAQAKPMALCRDEPLANPQRYRRLQIACGDANMAETSTLLKIGATAICLRLVQSGAAPTLSLDDPVRALNAFSGDEELAVTVRTSRGRLRAVDLQWIWLEAAAAHHETHGLPADEAEVLTLWELVLTELEADPERLVDRLDWVAKRRLLRAVAERRGLPLDHPSALAVDLTYHDVRADRSLYGGLVRAGKMRTVAAPDAVLRLRDAPPRTTRAALRGELVRRLAQCGLTHELNWAHWRTVGDELELSVDLSNPFAASTEQGRLALARLREFSENRRQARAAAEGSLITLDMAALWPELAADAA
ncbi:MAG: proteasome accessory factor PafA2 family protein [Acidimicrobiales bacterium]